MVVAPVSRDQTLNVGELGTDILFDTAPPLGWIARASDDLLDDDGEDGGAIVDHGEMLCV
jgi:hypothetical protein